MDSASAHRPAPHRPVPHRPVDRRPVDQRFIPPVTGIDLEQALNYIDLDAAGEAYAYGHYTSSRLFYRGGSRPRLEQVAGQVIEGASDPLPRIVLLADWVAGNVRWAGYHQKESGTRLPVDRAPTEEQLLDLGYGWCNEQARLFCALSQVIGIPSRIVFAFNKPRRYGHCVSEVLLDGHQWMAVDQSLGFCFAIDADPVPASRVFRDPIARDYLTPRYTARCQALLNTLGDIIPTDFTMAASNTPLDGFTSLGFHNYFIH